MGVVYKAHDPSLSRDIAIKVLPPERAQDPVRRKRFLREAKAASALNHPNIVTVYEVGSESSADFITMELIGGESLTGKLRSGPLPLPEALRYGLQIAEALACAHAANLVHRDLKPGNIMITQHGLVKLLDFGLAKRWSAGMPEPLTSPLTEEGAVLGTLAYMAPEQARGEETGPAADMFSFGVVLYEMLAGQRPFSGNSQVELFHDILYSDPPSLLQKRTDVPAKLAGLVSKALTKQPGRRCDAVEATNTLRGMVGALDLKPRWRMPSIGVHIAAAALLGLCGATWYWVPQAKTAVQRFRSVNSPFAIPASSSELVARGRAYLDRRDRKGNLEKATADFEEAIRQDGQNATAFVGLADAQVATYIESPDPLLLAIAKNNAEKAVALNSRLAAAHASRGWYLMHSGKREEALVSLNRALELDPQSAPTHLRVASTLIRLRRFDEADKHITQATQLARDHFEPYLHRGTYLAVLGRYEEAIPALQKSIALAPDNYATHRTLGASYFGLKRHDEAKAAFQRSLEARPTASAFSNLGTLYYYDQQYAEATEAFRQALKTDANNFVIWANLGDAYHVTPGNRDKAIDAYWQALRSAQERLAKTPNDITLQSQIAAILAKSGALAEARAALKNIVDEPMAAPDPLFHQTEALELTGQRSLALTKLGAALRAGLPISRVRNDPEFMSLRREPAYHELESKLIPAGQR